MSGYHIPVMHDQVLAGLRVRPGGRYIDATIGGGGHGIEVLKSGGNLLGIDADLEAVLYTRKNFKSQVPNLKEDKDWRVVQGNFRDVVEIAKENGFEQIEGIVFDLGVSSHQIDTPGRGFSYRFTDAPLDLRMDQGASGETAAQLVNRLSESQLYDVLATFGEEQLAGPISRALVRARSVEHIRTVGDLISIVESVVRDRRARYPVFSRVFQALRIAVNDELEALKKGLEGAGKLLIPGGRLAVITFHSLEDRIVKQYMRSGGWSLVIKKPVGSSQEEIEANFRSRSAKLRIAQKI